VRAQHWLFLLVAAGLPVALIARTRQRRRGALRFFAQPGSSLALACLAFFALVAVLAPVVAPYRPSHQLDIVALVDRAPSWVHPLGTDLFSRDVWSRVAWGARVSLGVGAVATAVTIVMGTLVGAVAGYVGGAVDAVVMRLVDVGLAVPRMFVVLVALAIANQVRLGPLVLLLGFTGWFGTSRLVRAEILTLRSRGFVDAARASGASPARIVARHLLPNALAPVIVAATLGVANVMLLEAALSFLGVGVQPPTPSWGNMIADGRDQLASAPWTTLAPGLALAMVVMALNLVGDGLRHQLDPRTAE
jgi:peptide/nickel transport system permease protein